MFDAPRELVWEAWTERERLMQWFGPKGFTMPVARFDFRPGGTVHYCLPSSDRTEMWGKFGYGEIVAPERIARVNSLSAENGNLTRHPISPTWPLNAGNNELHRARKRDRGYFAMASAQPDERGA